MKAVKFWLLRSTGGVAAFRLLVGIPSLWMASSIATVAVAQEWTQFEMNRKDADGRFLWTARENWNQGLPHSKLSVEIGDDHSGQALHCVIPTGVHVECQHFELAEHARTQGTTLRLEKGARFTIHESAVLSKDRESWCYVDGTLRCTKQGRGLRVGGPWGRPDLSEPASCHVQIGATGIVDAWFVGINTTHRAETVPSSPWGPRFYSRSTDSEIVINGGKLFAREGLRISTCDSRRPGRLCLNSHAVLTNPKDSQYGIDVWCGIWEINGSAARIEVGDVEFWGNKFQDAINPKTSAAVGEGLAVLKLSGDGISTIHAGEVNFVAAVVLDVNHLTISPGTYTVVDGAVIKGTNLRFAPGTDRNMWTFRFDQSEGDLLLTKAN